MMVYIIFTTISSSSEIFRKTFQKDFPRITKNMQTDSRFHKFTDDELEGIDLPSLFTYPFNYVPHKLCKIASQHLTDYLNSRSDWDKELQAGKMMGVLIVKHNDNIGYLTAYSGNLAHRYNHEYFVPAVYDLLSNDGFFPPEEAEISEINRKIKDEEKSPARQSLIAQLLEANTQSKIEIDAYRELMQQSKINRDTLRREGVDETMLIAESQFQKAELKRIRSRWQQVIENLKSQLADSDLKIAQWKASRKQRSQALQLRIFRNFVMLNARGESRDLCDIFESIWINFSIIAEKSSF
mgnify:CR=1 FL=1